MTACLGSASGGGAGCDVPSSSLAHKWSKGSAVQLKTQNRISLLGSFSTLGRQKWAASLVPCSLTQKHVRFFLCQRPEVTC